MVLFAQVVDAGSFAAAARDLNQSPSAVSKQMSHLEDRIGVRLLKRSRHGVVPTDEGRSFYVRCADVSRKVSAALDLMASLTDHPQGRLSVVSTVAFGKSQIMPLLPEFLAAYPDLDLKVAFTDRRVDFEQDGVDLAIQFAEQIEDQSLVARKLATNRRVICASPDYLARFGTPTGLGALAGHNILELSAVPVWNDWAWGSGSKDGERPYKSNFEANSGDALYRAALSGIGIARLPGYLVGADLAASRLMRILPDVAESVSNIYAVYSARRNLSPKVRAFIDHLVGSFSPVPPWERSPGAGTDAA